VAEDAGFLNRPDGATVRVMSYNVNWDAIFPPLDPESHALRSSSRGMAFRRIVAAVRPDVLCLQEINPERDPAQTAAIIDEALGAEDNGEWTATSRRDSLITSRYPLVIDGYELEVPRVPIELAQASALVDLPDELLGGRDLFVICAHFKSGGAQYDLLLRQRQADVVMRAVGDALAEGGALDLPPGTPIVILGDFNVYTSDPAAHLTTLLTGDIKNENSYGPDVAPDWDGTALTDLLPSQNALGQLFYTWRNDGGPNDPGILDHIIFSDSAMIPAHSFVLNTTLMSPAALEVAGLRLEDVILDPQTGDFDHLPLVVDFGN
jgi:endonuclease/exonuclease/phosphatase family metal-dependent hydrolase